MILVEGDDPVRQRLHRLADALERLGQRLLLTDADTHPAMQFGKDDFPEAATTRQGIVERAFEPAHQLAQMEQVPGQQQ